MNTNHKDEDPTPSSQDDESVHNQLPLTYVIDNELDRETEVLEEFIEDEELLVELERSAGQLIELEETKINGGWTSQELHDNCEEQDKFLNELKESKDRIKCELEKCKEVKSKTIMKLKRKMRMSTS